MGACEGQPLDTYFKYGHSSQSSLSYPIDAVFLPDRLHLRQVILFFPLTNVKMKKAERQMDVVYKGDTPSYNTIQTWFGRFSK